MRGNMLALLTEAKRPSPLGRRNSTIVLRSRSIVSSDDRETLMAISHRRPRTPVLRHMRTRREPHRAMAEPLRRDGKLVTEGGITYWEYTRDPEWKSWSYEPWITVTEPIDPAEPLDRYEAESPELFDAGASR